MQLALEAGAPQKPQTSNQPNKQTNNKVKGDEMVRQTTSHKVA
jgi:hypothetical protein